MLIFSYRPIKKYTINIPLLCTKNFKVKIQVEETAVKDEKQKYLQTMGNRTNYTSLHNDFLNRLYFLQGGLDLVKIFSGDPESIPGVPLYKVGMMRSTISHSMVKMYSAKLDIIHRYCMWYFMFTF